MFLLCRQLLVIDVLFHYATITWIYVPELCAIELHVYPFKLLFEYINIYSFKFWTDGNKDLDEHASTSSEGNIYFEFSMKVQDLK